MTRQHHMTPHERDEGYDFEGQRERNCRFGDPVVDSERYKLWERLTDALSGLPLTDTQVNDLEAVFAEHFGIKIDNAEASGPGDKAAFAAPDGCHCLSCEWIGEWQDTMDDRCPNCDSPDVYDNVSDKRAASVRPTSMKRLIAAPFHRIVHIAARKKP